jgi:hypothetical protein
MGKFCGIDPSLIDRVLEEAKGKAQTETTQEEKENKINKKKNIKKEILKKGKTP